MKRPNPPPTAPPTPLLDHLQGLIERTYGLPRLFGDAGRFLVGDRGYRWLYGAGDGAALPADLRARLMVRPFEEVTQAALYYPDALVRHLEIHDPRRGLGDENIDAFATFVEELDHLLTLASRSAAGRRVSLLELEHHAAVTKYLLVVHFLGRLTRRRRVADLHRLWARHHLFEKYAAGGGEEGERYRTAARLAGRYVALLDTLPGTARRAELIAFHERPFAEQVRHIEAR